MERGGGIYEYDIFLVRGFVLVVFSWLPLREAVGTVLRAWQVYAARDPGVKPGPATY